MIADHAAALHALAEALPDGATVPVPRAWLLELLGGAPAAEPSPLMPADLTVPEVAARFHKAPSTVRGWICSGRLVAYHFGRELRVTAASLTAFEAAVRNQESPRTGASRKKPTDLGAWRRARSAS